MEVKSIVLFLIAGPPEITQVDRVFLLAFPAMHHLVAGNIGKHPFYKIAAVGAADIPQGKPFRFTTGKPELIQIILAHGGLAVHFHGIHRAITPSPSPISPVMYSEISCLSIRDSSFNRMRKAV